ncbi:MAG: hypothetical protein AB7N65_15645 [Vicinamibacterales bacterium]
MRTLYEKRTKIVIDNETTVLAPLGTKFYYVQPATAGGPIKATLTYSDPMGTPGTMVARVNDIDLKLTSPSNVVYWGNQGLSNANWSSPGGSADQINTVENVFIESAEAGTWKVEVIVKAVNQDGHVETPQYDVDYALVITGVTTGGSLIDPSRPLGTIDLFRYLDAFFRGEELDANGDGATDATDVYELISKI